MECVTNAFPSDSYKCSRLAFCDNVSQPHGQVENECVSTTASWFCPVCTEYLGNAVYACSLVASCKAYRGCNHCLHRVSNGHNSRKLAGQNPQNLMFGASCASNASIHHLAYLPNSPYKLDRFWSWRFEPATFVDALLPRLSKLSRSCAEVNYDETDQWQDIEGCIDGQL